MISLFTPTWPINVELDNFKPSNGLLKEETVACVVESFALYFTVPFEKPDFESSTSPVIASTTYEVVNVPVGVSAFLIEAEIDCYIFMCVCVCFYHRLKERERVRA